MLSRKNALLSLCTLALLSTLSGCAKQKLVISEEIQLEAAQQAESTTTALDKVIMEAEQDIQKAKKDSLEFFAPLHLENAQNSLDQAKYYQENPPEEVRNAALMSAIASKKLVEKAYANKATVESNLKDTLANKAIIDDLNASELYSERYQDILSEIQTLIEYIETGDLSAALSGQESVIEEIVELEIDILINKHLEAARRFLEKADSIDAEENAPATYSTAQTKMRQTEQFIRKNNRNRIGVEKAGKEAFKAMQKAYYIASDSQALVEMDADEAEKHLLSLLQKFSSLNQTVGKEELLPQPFDNVTAKVIELVGLLKQQNEQLNASLAKTESELIETTEQMEKERETYASVERPLYYDEPVEVEEMEEMDDEEFSSY